MRANLNKVLMLFSCATILSSLVSCISTDLSQVSTENEVVKDKSEYFDFSTKQSVRVTINYKKSTQPVNVSVYTTYPYNEIGELDATVKPIYSAFTSESGIFDATVTAPSDADRLYISTMAVGYPVVINESQDDSSHQGLPITNGAVIWTAKNESDLSELLPLAGAATTRVDLSEVNIAANRRIITAGSLYALYDTYSYGTYEIINSQVPNLYSQYTDDFLLTSESTVGELCERLSSTLYYSSGTKKNNAAFVKGSDVVNFKVLDTTSDGKPVQAAQVELVFLSASGNFHNAVAYYYYPSDLALTKEELKALPKFSVFPRTTIGKPGMKIGARLQFFGANYDEAGVDAFPPGYTIGWMLVANCGFTENDNTIDKVDNHLAQKYSEYTNCIYSNTIANNLGTDRGPAEYVGQPLPGCLAIFDEKSETVVIGFEDHSYQGQWGDESFEDILFFVACSPIEALGNIVHPDMPTTQEILGGPNWQTSVEVGTLAFEDLWPSEGDYDLNDMVLEYTTTISYNQNNEIREIVDEFTPIHNGASYKNAFGVVINEDMGTVDKENSKYARQEATNRFIMWTDNSNAVKSTGSYRIVRKWSEGNYLKREDRQSRDINPFIVIKYQEDNRNRAEVHLPKYSATPWGDSSLNNTAADAYYVNRDGQFPFAIELYGVIDWAFNKVEKRRIDDSRAYPRFATWAASSGEKATDWYK